MGKTSCGSGLEAFGHLTDSGSLNGSAKSLLNRLLPGDHLCCIFETKEEHTEVLVPYIKAGLEADQKCFYIADNNGASRVRQGLEQAGAAVDACEKSGQLAFLTSQETYLQDGTFSPERMIARLREETERALDDGFTALRVTGEMTWALKGAQGSELLLDYENQLNNFFPGSQCLAICQYDRQRFGPQALLEVLKTHPLAILGTQVCENFYFVPPEERVSPNRDALELDRWMQCLRGHAETNAALRESERLYRLIAENASDVIATADRDLKMTYVSPSIEKLLGIVPEERLKRPFGDYLTETSRKQVANNLRELFANEKNGNRTTFRAEPLLLEHVVKGKTIWTESAVTYLRDGAGELSGFLSVSRDVTDRKLAEDALREAKEQAERYLELANVMFVGLSSDGTVTLANRKTCEVLKASQSQIAGKDWFASFVPERMRDSVRDVFDQLMAGTIEPVEHFGNPVVDSQGQERLVAWHNTYLKDDHGKIIGTLSSGEDITNRKRLEAERQRLEEQMVKTQKLESLGMLAGGIAHDFNNILVSIVGGASLGLLEAEKGSSLDLLLQRIKNGALRASDLANQMLAYAGKAEMISEAADLSAMVQEMTKLIEASISKKAMLTFELADEPAPIKGDTTQIRQVIMNLITNASEALEDAPGEIKIRTAIVHANREMLSSTYLNNNLSEGPYALLEVQDTGSGMDEETLRKLFDPFFTTKFTGRGIGLSAVLGIVQGHAGAISITSSTGHGSTFRILLPRWQGAGEQRPEAHVSSEWRGAGTILVVDDEPTVRATTRLMLEQLGFDVIEAADGQEAITIYVDQHDSICGVLLDLTMPQLDGIETLERLSGISTSVPVVLMSGFAEDSAVRAKTKAKLAGFMKKPFDTQTLAEVLRRAMESGQ